ncbi:MAG TPA: DUF3592 domain-containing protein [Candidatus Saccharimonadales bacterium]|nr:DUF3592 domain-containing protein [Candidatus Saccharimonadales bacterium]
MFYKNIKGHAEQFLGNYKQKNPATFAAAQQAIGGLLILDGFVGIDNPLGGKKRNGIFGSLIGVIVGLVFVFGTGFIGNLFGINKLTATTTATVVSVSQPTYSNTTGNNNNSGSSSCTVQAKYTVNGKEYTQTASSGSSSACSLTQGQTININYDPNSPGAFAYDLNTVKTVLKIFPIVGAIVAVTSLVTFAIRLFSIIFGWKLLKSGRALAKTLPAGTDLATIKNEIKQNFAKSVFGMGGNNNPPASPLPPNPQSPTDI